MQVANDLTAASAKRPVRIVQLYGGRAYEPQVAALTKGVEVVVGTPGRMIDLLNQGHLNLTRAQCVVLDEADEMLDLGFLPDVEKLLSRTPAARQTMLFSATMPGAVVSMARRYMTQPTHIRANDPDDGGQTVKNIKQVVYRAHALDKVEVLARILQAQGRGLSIVFARTKRTAAKVADDLTERGFAAGAIHGDLGQGAREQALRAFRNGKVDVLVATDVAARGIDVDDVTHVINYQCPEDEKTYLHRTGRTGRAGNKGTAVTFVDWDDMPRWGLINKALGLDIPEPVETYSTSPHLFTDLDIPEGTKGRLPKSAQTRAGLGAETLEDLGETGKRGGGAPKRDGGSRDSSRGSARSSSREAALAREAAPAAEAAPAGEARRPRTRQRTRSSQSGTQSAEAAAPRAADSTSAPTTGPSSNTTAVKAENDGAERPRRQRSRRRSRGDAPAAGGDTPVTA